MGYDTIILRNERKGENEFSGTGRDSSSLIFSSVTGWKLAIELRFYLEGIRGAGQQPYGEGVRTVMRRVFEGGEGVINGGREERSSDSGVWVPFDMEADVGLEEEEVGGE